MYPSSSSAERRIVTSAISDASSTRRVLFVKGASASHRFASPASASGVVPASTGGGAASLSVEAPLASAYGRQAATTAATWSAVTAAESVAARIRKEYRELRTNTVRTADRRLRTGPSIFQRGRGLGSGSSPGF